MTIASRRSLPEIVEATIVQLDSTWSRMIYLARCREADGRYRHYGWSLTHPEQTIHQQLSQAHRREFDVWLNASMEEQHAQLAAWLQGLDRRRVIASWSQAEPWRALAPTDAAPAEIAWFALNLATLIKLLARR